MVKRITDLAARLVESLAIEFPVTLIVDGTPVTGLLTTPSRFHQWTSNALVLASMVGPMTDGATEPMTDVEQQAVRDEWEAAHPDPLAAQDDLSFPEVCLRDATIRHGQPFNWIRCPYLLIDADHVGAITMAAPEK